MKQNVSGIGRRQFLGGALAGGLACLAARGVEPRDERASVGAGGRLVYRFAPASVTLLQLSL